jgi:hypothetical protein
MTSSFSNLEKIRRNPEPAKYSFDFVAPFMHGAFYSQGSMRVDLSGTTARPSPARAVATAEDK